MRRRRLWLYWALLLLLAAASETLLVLNRATWTLPADPFGVGSILVITYGVAGTLILSRRPGNAVGRIFLFLTTVLVVNQAASEYAIYAYNTAHTVLPGAGFFAWLSGWSFFPVWPLGLTLTFLAFPDGIERGRLGRLALGLGVVGTVALVMATLGASGFVVPSGRVEASSIPVLNATGFLPPGVPGPLMGLGWLFGGVALILSVVVALRKMRGATGERRQQIRWLAYFAAPVAPAFAAHFVLHMVGVGWSHDYAFPVFYLVFLLGVPLATGIAVSKYRLYDLDVVVSRALVYGSLAALITAVYVGIAVGIGTLVGSGGNPNLGLSILATAIVAVGFQPVRERLQTFANRLVYGTRATPYEVLSQFSERVAASYAVDDVMPRMARVLADGTGAQRADVWLRRGASLQATASWPGDAGAREPIALSNGSLPAVPNVDRIVEVRQQADLLGALSITKRAGESLTPIEEKLLADLAHQAGLVLKNVGLTADLAARLEELRASRQRLVAAQDEERRRLERNLHDGAQQHLVALKVKLGLAELLVTKDTERARSVIGEVKHEADDALETLRDLARGIYPPLLASNGLVAALQAQARKATVPVELVAGEIARYPQETEAAVYFCCLEALQNIQKYADAGHVILGLKADDGHLYFNVSDDGRGFDAISVRRGAGLTNMADRLDALGGSLEVTAQPGKGTSVQGAIPLTKP